MLCLLGGMGCECFSFGGKERTEELLMTFGRYVWGDNVHKAKTMCERYAWRGEPYIDVDEHS